MNTSYTLQNGKYTLTTDRSRMDAEALCDLIYKQKWGPRRPRRITRHCLKNSVVFVVLCDDALAGCCRVITDEVTFAYFQDVIIDDEHRGQGLGAWMIRSVMAYPPFLEMRRWLLQSEDARGFYKKLGFDQLTKPGEYLEWVNPYPRE